MHHLVYFFCFRYHHTYTIFLLRYYVVVILALRVPSNSVSSLHSFTLCLHTSFPICLLKSSCNSYPTSTCLMTNTLRVLESRVFLHYLINFCELPNFACISLSKKLLAVGPGQTDRTLTFLFLLCSSSSSARE